MAITTFSELKTAGANWITRSDLDDRWAEFILLAEGVANRLLDTRQMYTRTTSFTVDSATETVPTGFASVRSFFLNTAPVTKLQFVRPDEFDDYREAAIEGVGKPKYYTIIGDSFLFSPSPDSAYTATLTYRKNLTALSDSNTSNWLLAAYPDVYLSGMLAFAYQYTEDTEMEGKFFSNFTAGIGQLNANDSRSAYGSSPARRVRGFA